MIIIDQRPWVYWKKSKPNYEFLYIIIIKKKQTFDLYIFLLYLLYIYLKKYSVILKYAPVV